MLLGQEVLALSQKCVQVRRRLHRTPETGFQERCAHRVIMETLELFPPDRVEGIAETGVKAVYFGENRERAIGFRADMDGLNIEELVEAPYKSTLPGKMHACGHDGHVTMLLLLAEIIHGGRMLGKNLPVTVVLIFQPGEEGMDGASRMIEEGALKDPDIGVIYGMHLWPDVPKGKIGVRWGPMMAMTSQLDITVHGVSSHGASPQMGVDAVVAAAELISLLQTAITRNVDPHQGAVLTIGKINGGVGRSIIADKVTINATLRVFSDETYQTLIRRIHAMADGLATATEARIVIDELLRHPCVDNPRPLVEDFYRYIEPSDRVLVDRVMISEDFSCYQKEVPGLFLFLGVGGGRNVAPLHNGLFDFDEDALLYGVEIYRRIAYGETV